MLEEKSEKLLVNSPKQRGFDESTILSIQSSINPKHNKYEEYNINIQQNQIDQTGIKIKILVREKTHSVPKIKDKDDGLSSPESMRARR